MKTFLKNISLYLSFTALLFLSFNAYAGNGGMPKGKPFVELQGQIIEVQSDIDTLNMKYDTVMGKIALLELADDDLQGQIDAINDEVLLLQAKDADLQAQVMSLIASVANQEVDIEQLFDNFLALKGDIIELTITTGDNADLLAQLQSDLDAITAVIAEHAEGLLTLSSDVEENINLINLLQKDIKHLAKLISLKQDDISGVCKDNFFVQTVRDDGSLVCGYADDNGNIVTYVVLGKAVKLDNYTQTVTICNPKCYKTIETVFGDDYAVAVCPADYVVTGGGFTFDDQRKGHVRVQATFPKGDTRWYTRFENLFTKYTKGYTGRSYAVCVKNQQAKSKAELEEAVAKEVAKQVNEPM